MRKWVLQGHLPPRATGDSNSARLMWDVAPQCPGQISQLCLYGESQFWLLSTEQIVHWLQPTLFCSSANRISSLDLISDRHFNNSREIQSLCWVLSLLSTQHRSVVVWIENAPYKLVCLHTWFPGGGAIWQGCGIFRRWRLTGERQSKKKALSLFILLPLTVHSLLPERRCKMTNQPLAPAAMPFCPRQIAPLQTESQNIPSRF